MKYTVKIGSGAMIYIYIYIYILSFIKIDSGVKKLLGWRTHTRTHTAR
jgi:hypothetical protein